MAKNPLIRSFSKKVSKPLPNKSAGNLEDYVIRKVINTKEGTITKVPVEDNDIANKKFVLDNVGVGTWTDTSTNTGTNKTIDSFTNRVEADEVHIKIRNESGSIMTKRQLIYISGYNIGEDVPLVSLTDASNSSTMPMLAMINDADIVNNATGHATMSGRVFNIDTSAFSAGDTAYVSTTPGELSTRPSGTSDKVQAIGIILRSHASLGVIEIIGAGRTNDIPNDIDHDTDIINVSANDHHNESHNIASHSDTTATGAELNTLTGGTDTTLHDHDGISENTTHRGSDGSDHSAVVTNTSKVSFSKTNVKGTINHGSTAATARPTGFDSVHWIGTVEPTNATNDDDWTNTT